MKDIHNVTASKGYRVSFTKPKVDLYGVGLNDLHIANMPEFDSTGKSNLAGSVGINRFGDYDGDRLLMPEEIVVWLVKRRLRAQLRCKTKRGPKRKGLVSVALLRRECYLRNKVNPDDPIWIF